MLEFLKMIREEQIRILKGLINYLDSKTNVDAGGIMKAPADTYTSQERFDREWEIGQLVKIFFSRLNGLNWCR